MGKWFNYLLVAGALFIIYETWDKSRKNESKIKIKE